MCSCQRTKSEPREYQEIEAVLDLFRPNEHPEIELVWKLFEPEPQKSRQVKAEWPAAVAKFISPPQQYAYTRRVK